MTQDEYEAELSKRGLVKDGDPVGGLVPYRTLDGTGWVYVLDTTNMTNDKRSAHFDIQVATGQFTEFGF